MSSIKVKSELHVLLDDYIKDFKSLYGSEPDLFQLKLKLNDLSSRKKEEMFGTVFGSLNAKALSDCCGIVEGYLGSKENKGS